MVVLERGDGLVQPSNRGLGDERANQRQADGGRDAHGA